MHVAIQIGEKKRTKIFIERFFSRTLRLQRGRRKTAAKGHPTPDQILSQKPTET